jgi:pantoate kinase
MPFDEEDEQQSVQKNTLKKVSSQKSIFENLPKKPTSDNFDEKVKQINEQNSLYKQRAAEYSIQFKKSISDKTLLQNKNVFAIEIEQEIIANMIKLAAEINEDPNEQEGMGSLMWVALLLRTFFHQRDRINELEYTIVQMKKNLK